MVFCQSCFKNFLSYCLERNGATLSFHASLKTFVRAKQVVCPVSYKHHQTVRFFSFSSSKLSSKSKLDISKIPNIKEFLSKSVDVVSKQEIDLRLGDQEDLPPYLENAVYTDAPNGKTVYFETYGCQMNVNDAEYAWAVLKSDGYKRVDDLDKADVVLLVTCSIREKAEERIWNKLRVLKKHKDAYHTSGYPKIGVLGCMAERLKKQIIEQQKAVDIVAGPDSYRDLPRLLEQATSESTTAINVMLSADETYADIMPVRFDERSKSAFVSIMRGCDNMCSYCIVPFTRGRERSRPVHSIIDEIKQLSDMGYKQVTLLGQNVNSYRDVSHADQSATSSAVSMSRGFKTIYKPRLGGFRFADLLHKVSEVNPEMRVRFTSPHPKDFPDEVLQVVSERANICKHIHLPAQSGSTRILDLMRRGHTREDYVELVERIRSLIPGVTISTDLITGFCFEDAQDHQDTLSLMELVKYNFAFMFMYSMRKKTHAYHKMEDTVPQEVKYSRLQEIHRVYRECLLAANELFVGTTQLVLLEKKNTKVPGMSMGRMDGHMKVFFPQAITPLCSGGNNSATQELEIGDYVAVKLTTYEPNYFTGTPICRTSLADFYSNSFR